MRFALAAVFAVALAALMLAAPARAATFTVTKTGDTADGACDADCSLREAVIAANASADDDTIVLPAGTFLLSLAGVDEDAAATGDLDVANGVGELLIVGAGRSDTTIDGGGIDRVFDVLEDAELELRDLTVTGGDPSAAAAADDRHGGGLRTHDGRILLTRVTFDSNVAANGGAIHQFGTGNPRVVADLTVFSDNDALGDGGSGFGGAVYNNDPAGDSADGQLVARQSRFESNVAANAGSSGGAIFSSDDGHVAVFESRFINNEAQGFGGAIRNDGLSRLSVADTELIGNEAPDGRGGTIHNQNDASAAILRSEIRDSSAFTAGGALFNQNEAQMTVVGSRIESSTATGTGGINGRGGAIFNQNHGLLTIFDSVIEGGSAEDDGGGMFIQNDSTTNIFDSAIRGFETKTSGGGIFLGNTAVLNMRNSTVSGNEALSADAGEGGGGIYLDFGATLHMSRSTVSGNSTAADGGGIGTDDTDSDINIRIVNSTISGNDAANTGGGLLVRDEASAVVELTTIAENSAASGGGIYNESATSQVLAERSLLGGNTAPDGPNCAGPITSAGFNLDIGASCGFGATGDIENGSALLGPLANNGGPTETHALGAGSDAVDAAGSCDRVTDQRGTSRPQGAACDIGSFELVPPPPEPPPPDDPPASPPATPPAADTRVSGSLIRTRPRQLQRGRRIAVRVRVGAAEPIIAAAGGFLRIRGIRRAIRLRVDRARVGAGRRQILVLVPRRRAHSLAIARLLRRGAVIYARLIVRMRDAAGNTAGRRLTVRLLARPVRRR